MKIIKNKTCTEMILQNQKGFTLIEVMIAIFILSVGLLAVASMQVSAIRGNHFSDNVTVALALAEEGMEDLLNKSYSHTWLTDGDHDTEEASIDKAGEPGGPFSRTWEITDSPSLPQYKEISMIVAWANSSHRVTLESIKRP